MYTEVPLNCTSVDRRLRKGYTKTIQLHRGIHTMIQPYAERSITTSLGDCLLDIYGEVFKLRGKRDFIPSHFQGQYEDNETGLYYNRFRHYSPHAGNYYLASPDKVGREKTDDYSVLQMKLGKKNAPFGQLWLF